MQLLRSWLFTPGNNLRRLLRTATLDSDAVIMDLEDSVPFSDTETARLFIRDAVPEVAKQRSSIYVRVNPLPSGLAVEDLQWTVQIGVAGILLPKAESAEEVLEAGHLISEREEALGLATGSIPLVPMLETARGILHAADIASARRVVALAFGAVDYARDMRIKRAQEGTELLYARSHVAVAARSAGVLAIDSPWTNLDDRGGLEREGISARNLGFHGKLLIHPSQIKPVNRIFSPDHDDVAHARRIVAAYEQAATSGVGAIAVDGQMVDTANYRQAVELVAWSDAIPRAESEEREP